jgi:hypothetical protein
MPIVAIDVEDDDENKGFRVPGDHWKTETRNLYAVGAGTGGHRGLRASFTNGMLRMLKTVRKGGWSLK